MDGEDPVADALEGWRPGPHSLERREIKADGRAALEFVRAREQPVGRPDIVDALEDRIDNAGISADGWWRRRARPALKHAPPVEMRGRRWVWVGDTKKEGDR